jgi:hypothetical protein
MQDTRGMAEPHSGMVDGSTLDHIADLPFLPLPLQTNNLSACGVPHTCTPKPWDRQPNSQQQECDSQGHED